MIRRALGFGQNSLRKRSSLARSFELEPDAAGAVIDH